MGKKSREKRDRKMRTTSTIDQHNRSGSKLIPPLLAPKLNVTPVSWANDRLPEMMWPALLVTGLGRDKALARFREVINFVAEATEPKPNDIGFAGLAALEATTLNSLLNVITEGAEAALALAPLLLLDHLPARVQWHHALAEVATAAKWEPLMHAVATCFDHQSQEATDCRWLSVMVKVSAGQMFLPSGARSQQMADEISGYPNVGDMRAVRPSIRAMEGAIRNSFETSEWPTQFWEQCHRDTPCVRFVEKLKYAITTPAADANDIHDLHAQLARHALDTSTTTAVDPKHEVIFGAALYALVLFDEIVEAAIAYSVVGRVALRTIAETLITMSYLRAKALPDLWRSYRAYGAGQAKLTFLKLEDVEAVPNSIDMETLSHLANEDHWQEFVSIELGHWEKSNLRKMSEEAAVKDVYDSYYQWPSHYAHAHWGAIRDSIFANCANPLHRFHRIPRPSPRVLPDVANDAAGLVNRLLDLVALEYPPFEARLPVKAD